MTAALLPLCIAAACLILGLALIVSGWKRLN